MTYLQTPVVVGLGQVSREIVQPILGDVIFIENPSKADLKIAQGAIVRAAFVVDEAFLSSAPKLSVLARTGVGFDLIDLKAADNRGIAVAITPGSNSDAVAEGVMAHVLHLVKRLGPLSKLVSDGNFDQRFRYPVGDLQGATLGVVGYGRIGKRVAKLSKAFEMNVLAYDPFSPIPDPMKVDSLEILFTKSDIVTLHLPLTPETRLIINKDSLRMMRQGTILINCSRGALVDLEAAHDALKSGLLGGIGLDVFDPEPPTLHPIFEHENVVLTPHVMGLSKQATVATFVEAARAVRAVLDGAEPLALANTLSYDQLVSKRSKS